MVKKPKEIELDANGALSLAAETLMRAADVAEKINDTETLLNVAAGWIEIYARLEPEAEEKPKPPLGFGKFPHQHHTVEPETAETETGIEVEDSDDED